MTAKQRTILGWTALIVLPVSYVLGSEIYYARSISPKGVSTVRDFFDRFGEPQRIRMVEHQGRICYEFTGHLPSAWVAAFPSEAPAYVFDEQGSFVGWCSDPGDAPSHRRTWHLQSTNRVEVGIVRKKLGM